ncbi:MAG: formyltransferase family protein [Phycisphaerales bacterium JB040]
MNEFNTPPFDIDQPGDPLAEFMPPDDEIRGARPATGAAVAEPPVRAVPGRKAPPATRLPAPALRPRDPGEYVLPEHLSVYEQSKMGRARTHAAMRTLTKYVLVLDDYEHTAGLLSEFLAEHAMSTVGVNIQPCDVSGRTAWQKAFDAAWTYGPVAPARRCLRRARRAAASRVTEQWLRRTRNPVRPATAARHYGVKTDAFPDVNAAEFIATLRRRGVELLVCIGCNQIFSRALRDALPYGAINLHHGLLPHYRGFAPTLHALADEQQITGVTVHYATDGLHDGPILTERTRAVRPKDSLADVRRRQQPLAAEALIQAVRKIEQGTLTLAPNPDPGYPPATTPHRRDVKRLRRAGRKVA